MPGAEDYECPTDTRILDQHCSNEGIARASSFMIQFGRKCRAIGYQFEFEMYHRCYS